MKQVNKAVFSLVLWACGANVGVADIVKDVPFDAIKGPETQTLPVDGIWHRGAIYDSPVIASGIAIGTDLVSVDGGLAIPNAPGGLIALNAKVHTKPGMSVRLPSTDWGDFDLTPRPLAVWLEEPVCQIGIEFWAEDPKKETQKGISVVLQLLDAQGGVIAERDYQRFVGLSRVGFDVTDAETDIKAVRLLPTSSTGVAIISVRARTCSLLLG